MIKLTQILLNLGNMKRVLDSLHWPQDKPFAYIHSLQTNTKRHKLGRNTITNQKHNNTDNMKDKQKHLLPSLRPATGNSHHSHLHRWTTLLKIATHWKQQQHFVHTIDHRFKPLDKIGLKGISQKLEKNLDQPTPNATVQVYLCFERTCAAWNQVTQDFNNDFDHYHHRHTKPNHRRILLHIDF